MKKYYAVLHGPDTSHNKHTVKFYDKLRDAKAYAHSRRGDYAAQVGCIMRNHYTGGRVQYLSHQEVIEEWTPRQ